MKCLPVFLLLGLTACASFPVVDKNNLLSYKAVLTTAPSQATLADFDFDRQQPLAAKIETLPATNFVAMLQPNLVSQEVSFAGPWGDRITGYLFQPKVHAGPLPAVLVLAGSPGAALAANAFAGQLAEKGLVTLTVDLLSARAPLTDYHDLGRIVAWELGQVRDLRRALDFLRSRPEVDATRLGVTGRSLGGMVGASLTGLEPGVRAFLFQIATAGPLLVEVLSRGGAYPVEVLKWTALPSTQVQRTAPILWQNQVEDPIIAKPLVELSFAWSGGPKELRWYPGRHSVNEAMDEEGAQWLYDQLVK